MRHANTRALYEYWNALRGGRAAPYRREINPREIAPLLESTFILESCGPDNIRFRLAGTRLCESFGMELRGMSALALWHGECRAKVRDALYAVTSGPQIAHLSCTVENRGGFLYNAEFLYMPLRSDAEDFSRILGCGYYMGEAGAYAHLYAPIHHWVDSVSLYDIDVSEALDVGAPPSDGLGLRGRRASDSRASLTSLRGGLGLRRSADAPHAPPKLVAIDGGKRLKGGDFNADAPRRGHLRLVRDEAQ